MSSRVYEIILRVVVFASTFAWLIVIGGSIAASIYPIYTAVAVLGVALALGGPIATGLLMARLGERTSVCIRLAIAALIPIAPPFFAFQRHRATRLLYANRKGDAAALQALTELGNITKTHEPRGVESLIQTARGNSDPTIRADAILWVSDVKTPRVLELVIEALKDRDTRVRQRAAEALGDWQDAQAVASLAQALNDENENVRKAVAAALAKLTGAQKTKQPHSRTADAQR